MSYLASIPRVVLVLVALALFGTAVRWRFRWYHAIDIALIALAIQSLTIGMAAWVGALLLIRHVPAFALDIAQLAQLDSYDGITRRMGWLLLPAAAPHVNHYVPIATGATVALSPQVVHVSVPGTAGTPDTNAVAPPDRDITKEAWIDAMSAARDEHGKFIFSANRIFEAVGGHRATVLARVKEVQTGQAPAQFRQEDGAVAPAAYPVTKSA